jgi:ubiquitin-conjugating enzyme E2 M
LEHAQVFHPNIDLDGNICLNILREDWKPVLSISSIIYGLQFLFLVRLVSAQA